MSIRLRFTLLYNAILMLTLLIFGVALYSIQAQTTFEALKEDLQRSSESIGASIFSLFGSARLMRETKLVTSRHRESHLLRCLLKISLLIRH